MKAKEQFLDFINLALGILLIAFFIYFFIIPGNFERFQVLLASLAPLIFFAATLIIRLRITSKNIQAEGGISDESTFIRLTYWDKIKLEFILTGLPIGLILWTIIFNVQNLQSIGESIVVFLVNSAVLHSIFKKSQLI